MTSRQSIPKRVAGLGWPDLEAELDVEGCTRIENLLGRDECEQLSGLYPREAGFRKRVVMARHAFGQGEYKYFGYPLPPLVEALRASFYQHLCPLANRWNRSLGLDVEYPDELKTFLARCHAAGQPHPTPLMLTYAAGDYNRLHQDLYGPLAFPLQVAVLLSQPERDFTGGQFVMTEQRPRTQSRPLVVPLQQGDAVIFATHRRPVQGTRGTYRVQMRHGVSRLHSGHRTTLGLIFHDAG